MHSRHHATCLGSLAATGSCCLFVACASTPPAQTDLSSTSASREATLPTVVHTLLADELRYRFTCPKTDGAEWYSTAIATLDDLLGKAGTALQSMGVANW